MKYEIKFTNQFKRDLKLAKKQNRNLRRYNAAANAGLHNDIFTHKRTNTKKQYINVLLSGLILID